LLPEHMKPRLLGHGAPTPGLNFIYAHLNRRISARDLNMIYVQGAGHGRPGIVDRKEPSGQTNVFDFARTRLASLRSIDEKESVLT
jgi:phosphoketolase